MKQGSNPLLYFIVAIDESKVSEIFTKLTLGYGCKRIGVTYSIQGHSRILECVQILGQFQMSCQTIVHYTF